MAKPDPCILNFQAKCMRELLATNDVVLLNYVEVLLRDANIACVVLDRNMSVLEGSVGVIPRRLLVAEPDWHRAASVMDDAGLEKWVRRVPVSN